MPEQGVETLSLVDRILAQTLQALGQHPEFDQPSLERLQNLVESATLTNYESVVSALTVESGH